MNYRTRLGELDVIAADRRYVIFAEVKLRKNAAFAEAREFVTFAKRQKLAAAAEEWLQKESAETSAAVRCDRDLRPGRGRHEEARHPPLGERFHTGLKYVRGESPVRSAIAAVFERGAERLRLALGVLVGNVDVGSSALVRRGVIFAVFYAAKSILQFVFSFMFLSSLVGLRE